MDRNGTLASPAVALASSVLPAGTRVRAHQAPRLVVVCSWRPHARMRMSKLAPGRCHTALAMHASRLVSPSLLAPALRELMGMPACPQHSAARRAAGVPGRGRARACARRPHEQGALGDARAQVLVLGGRLEEVDKFHHLLLGLVAAGHVLEHDLVLRVFVQHRHLRVRRLSLTSQGPPFLVPDTGVTTLTARTPAPVSPNKRRRSRSAPHGPRALDAGPAGLVTQTKRACNHSSAPTVTPLSLQHVKSSHVTHNA